MDSQDSRFTTPPPYYGNLYDAETPPSAQPRSPLYTPNWEVPKSLLPDSLNESVPSPPLFVPDSQAESSQELSQEPQRHYICAAETSRDKRLQIQTALLFRIPYAEIKEVLDVTDHQI